MGSQEGSSIKLEEAKMDSTTLIRIIAGALAVVVLLIIIWRRRRHASE
jgi:membrane protein DedA with SNARE-associated domain